MKKLLLGSAILAISSIGFNGVANAHDHEDFNAEQFEQALKQLNITSSAIGLERGDFQATSNAVVTPLYSGFGASAMSTVRAYRY